MDAPHKSEHDKAGGRHMACICKGFGIVHPVVAGRVDYARAVYCRCSPRAGQPASAPVSSPDIERDLNITYHADAFAPERAAREARALRAANREASAELVPESAASRFATQAELLPLRADLGALTARLAERRRYRDRF